MEATNTILAILCILVGVLGYLIYKAMGTLKDAINHLLSLGALIQNSAKHQTIKDDYFDLQARDIQGFLERFLGRDFNIQCTHTKLSSGPPIFKLWIWKRYETRDMGTEINGMSIPEIIDIFMHQYYSNAYFTDATAFPK